MSRIDSGALVTINRVLGLAGVGSGQTVLDGDHVDQVFEVAPVVRRSRTPANSGGIYNGAILNVHAGADSQANAIDLYAPGASAFGGWERVVPQGFDVWVLGAQVQKDSGAGDITGALLRLTAGDSFGLGIGVPSSFTPSDCPVLAAFSGTVIGAPSVIAIYPEVGTGTAVAKIGARIRRGFTLSLDTTSDGVVTVRCIITLGYFPEGLGQDALLY